MARRAVSAVFFAQGSLIGCWVSRIPAIKAQLGLSSLGLSVALIGIPVGLVLAMPAVSWGARRWTSARLTTAAALGTSLFLVLPAIAWSLPVLTASLVLFGFGMGALDVAANTQGVAVERAYGRSILSGLHGRYSAGVLLMASLGALAARLGVDPVPHFAAVALGVAAACAFAARWLVAQPPRASRARGAAQSPSLRRHPCLVALGLIMLCSFLAEGAVDDWSGVYLHEAQKASLPFAALGATACHGGMTVGRLLGDRLIARFGHRATLCWGALIAGAGMGGSVAAPTPELALAGYAVLGLGLATTVPIAVALTGDVPGVPSAWAIARVTTFGFAGLFLGPPLVGFLASVAGLRVALGLPCALMVAIVALGRVAASPAQYRDSQSET